MTRGGVQAQPPHDVLDVDDRIVHDLAERDDQPGDDHRVERAAAIAQDQRGGDERERNRDDADERRAPVVQKHHQDEHHQNAADQERAVEIPQRHLDERRGPEDGRVDVDVGQPRLQRGDRRFDVARDLQRVAVRLFLHDQHQAVAAIDHRVADRRRKAFDHLGDVADAQGVPGRCGPLGAVPRAAR